MSYMSLVSGPKNSTHGSSSHSESNRKYSEDRKHSEATSLFLNATDSGWDVRSALSRLSSLSQMGGGGAFAWLGASEENAPQPAMGESSSESGSLNSMDPDYGEQWARRLQKARPLNAEERDAALGRWLGNIVANLPPPRRLSHLDAPDVHTPSFDDSKL